MLLHITISLLILLMIANAMEYRLEGIVSTRGDVYSYGIILMETFIRKKLISVISQQHKGSYRCYSIEQRRQAFSYNKKSCLSSIKKLALECTIESPKEMINTKDEVARLKKIQIKLLM